MTIEVPNGDIIDKITILEIKKTKIVEDSKIKNILFELSLLKNTIQSTPLAEEKIKPYHQKLLEVNKQLWDIEDQLRDAEFLQIFDNKFIELARMVYKLNDQRCLIKRQINELTNSNVIEEKSYKKY